MYVCNSAIQKPKASGCDVDKFPLTIGSGVQKVASIKKFKTHFKNAYKCKKCVTSAAKEVKIVRSNMTMLCH